MAVSSLFPGFFTYLFVVMFGATGYMPLGRHSADFSKEGDKLAYAYNLQEVRLLDVETHTPGPPLYTAPEGYVVDTVHWSDATGRIYAVVHNANLCMVPFDMEYEDEPAEEKEPFKQWNVKILDIDPAGGASREITDRTYYCPIEGGMFGGMASSEPASGGDDPYASPGVWGADQEAEAEDETCDLNEPDDCDDEEEEVVEDEADYDSDDYEDYKYDYPAPELAAPYQDIENNGLSFKPVGWDTGTLYFIEPEDYTNNPTAVRRMDLTTGKADTAFILPDDARMFMLSEDGRYLACQSTMDIEQGFNVILRDVKTGEKIFEDTILKISIDDLSNDSLRNASAQFFFSSSSFSIISSMESMAAFDEQAGLFFYLKADFDTQTISLISYDLNKNIKKTIYQAYSIHAPIPIPQKKALLFSSYSRDILPYYEQYIQFDYLMQSFTGESDLIQKPVLVPESGLTLVSYEGEIINEYELPPITSPLMNGLKANVSLTPDGNLLAMNMDLFFSDYTALKNNPDVQKLPRGTADSINSLPMIINLQDGSPDIVITQPNDHAVAGLMYADLMQSNKASIHLDAALKGGELLNYSQSHLALKLLLAAQKQDDNNKVKEMESILLKQYADEKISPHTALALKYLTQFHFSGFSIYYSEISPLLLWFFNSYQYNNGFQPLPDTVEVLNDRQLAFVKSHLELADDSGLAQFLMAEICTHQGKYLEAVSHLDRMIPLLKTDDFYSSFGSVMDFNDISDSEFEEIKLMFEHQFITKLRGELYAAAGKYNEADEELSKFLDNTESTMTLSDYDNYLSVVEMRAEMYEKAGSYDEAITDYQELLETANSVIKDILDIREVHTSEQYIQELIESYNFMQKENPDELEYSSVDEYIQDEIESYKNYGQENLESLEKLVAELEAKIEELRKKEGQ